MKAMAAMKAMKAMKKKKVTKIARGKMARAVVFRGNKEKTLSGLKQTDLIKNSRGKIVSKKASAHAKKVRYANIKAGSWLSRRQGRSWASQAFMLSRKAPLSTPRQ